VELRCFFFLSDSSLAKDYQFTRIKKRKEGMRMCKKLDKPQHTDWSSSIPKANTVKDRQTSLEEKFSDD
jgi:hypothetical protein